MPTALRWAIDRGESGVPFVTYFPVVLLAALFIAITYNDISKIVSGFW